MTFRFGINGLGRIGRALLRLAHGRADVEVAAINDVVGVDVLARLLARDTIHGPFPGTVAAGDGVLVVGGREIPVFAEPEPAGVPWERAGVEAVVEATGRFARRDLAAAHLRGPVRRVVISANAPDVDATFCFGINEESYDPRSHVVVSNASCTTNCLALVAKVLHDAFTVRRALMSTVHPYTENQRLLDSAFPDPRRSRAAALNMIPTATTSARSLQLLLPELADRVDGFAVRVPTAAVAMLDLVADLGRPASADDVRAAFRAAAAGRMRGVLAATDEELVSSDFVGDSRSAVVDLPLVQAVDGGLVRVVAWYDNEWGYAHRLVDLLALLGRHAGTA
ncbi:MAG TPA: type I glyceraldehyde-3-phosphate dehydrogenase [Thermoanaerobaculia bacterium]|nr:type I glyceraldehyde-3-phosphate dehydrogenase [Thermoanaerobaculia bacterium]